MTVVVEVDVSTGAFLLRAASLSQTAVGFAITID